MIKTKEDLRFYLQEDAKRNGMAGVNRLMLHVRMWIGTEQAHIYHWMIHWRKWEYYTNTGNRLMALYHHLRVKRLGFKLGIEADINSIGYGLRIMHLSGGGGLRLKRIKAGNYCGFNAGVMVAGHNGETNPKIQLGDYVAFGPGSKAFGPITIGDHVFVAPNAVITKDCESNAIYAGVPAKLIKKKEETRN